MVKGVNKTVIEVNNTGSKVFDRIVFYVSADYGNLSAKQLCRAASNFTFQFDERAGKGYKSLRKRMLIRKKALISSAVVTAVAILGIVAAVIL